MAIDYGPLPARSATATMAVFPISFSAPGGTLCRRSFGSSLSLNSAPHGVGAKIYFAAAWCVFATTTTKAI